LLFEYASFNIIDSLTVHSIGQEGIHLTKNSSDNLITNCTIYDTGMKIAGFGEGIYVGLSSKFWEDNMPDKCDRNSIIGNHFGPNVSAEAIDIKEGTCCGLIKDNVFDGRGMSDEHHADTWVDIKGNDYKIEDNKGSYTIAHGFEVSLYFKSFFDELIFMITIYRLWN